LPYYSHRIGIDGVSTILVRIGGAALTALKFCTTTYGFGRHLHHPSAEVVDVSFRSGGVDPAGVG